MGKSARQVFIAFASSLMFAGAVLIVSPRSKPPASLESGCSQVGSLSANPDQIACNEKYGASSISSPVKATSQSIESNKWNEVKDGDNKTFYDHLTGWSTFSSAVLTGILAIIAGAQVGLFWWQLRIMRESIADTKIAADAAKKSADVSYRTLIMSQRPWVIADIEIGSDIVFDDAGEGRVYINFLLKNIGKSPAVNVDVNVRISPVFGDEIIIQKEIANPSLHRSPAVGNLGMSIFPGESKPFQTSLPISKDSLNKYWQKFRDEYETPTYIDNWFTIMLLGSVDYKFAFEDGHHQTGIMLCFLRLDDAGRWNNSFDIREKIVRKDRIALVPGILSIPPT
jgi:hypothetical protein